MRADLATARLAELYESQAIGIAGQMVEDIRSDEDRGYTVVSSVGGEADSNLVGGRVKKNMPFEDSQKLRASAFEMFYTNSHVKSIVRNFVKFVFGKGCIVSFVSKKKAKRLKDQARKALPLQPPPVIPPVITTDPETGEVKTSPPVSIPRKPLNLPPAMEKSEENILEYWNKVAAKNKWKLKEKELGRRGFRDGEVFIHIVEDEDDTDNNVPYLIFREPDAFVQPQLKDKNNVATYGIETDPNNVEKVIKYHHQSAQNHFDEILEADMVHIKFSVDSNVKRGRTLLEPVLKDAVKYRQWLDDRMVLNKVRTAIAVVKIVTGGRDNLSRVRTSGKTTGPRSALAQRGQKMLRPGSLLTATPGVDYKMLSANINAADVAGDGRNIILCMAAGSGLPEMFLTGDFSNANYSSSLTAQNPMVREFEDYQDTFGEYIKELISKILKKAIQVDEISQEDFDDIEIEVKWPPLINKLLKDLVAALSALHGDKIISKETYASECGFDYSDQKESLEREMSMEPPAATDLRGDLQQNKPDNEMDI